jgi:hypothetical protein
MPRKLRLLPLAAGLACSAFAAGADELRHIGFPASNAPPHMGDATRPRGGAWPILPAPRASGPGLAPRTSAQFVPHFGISHDISAGRPFVDGVYFSPAEGVEVTARTSLSDGFRWMLGLTFRF